MVNQEKDSKLFRHYFVEIAEQDDHVYVDEHKLDEQDKFSIGQVFNYDNVRQVLATCFKNRSNNARAQIWLSMAGIFVYLFVLMSVPAFEFQFYQKMYNWDATDMSFWESVGLIANSVFVLISTSILIRVCIKIGVLK